MSPSSVSKTMWKRFNNRSLPEIFRAIKKCFAKKLDLIFFSNKSYVNLGTDGFWSTSFFHSPVQVGQSIQEWPKWNFWRQPFKNLNMVYHFKLYITSNFLKTVFYKFHLVHSWILCPKYRTKMLAQVLKEISANHQ